MDASISVSRDRVWAVLRWLPWAAIVGLALWFRITSLGGFPEPDADECFFGIQAHHLITKGTALARTPSGNPTNPFLVAVEAPFLALFGPRFWVLRMPTAVSGVMVVVLMFVYCRRWYDTSTAMIAAGIMAVMPMAISVSRYGIESGVSPLFGLVAIHQAFQGRRVALLTAFLACLIIHPTNLFLAPILVCVYLARTLPRVERSRWWRVVLEVALGSATVTLVFANIALNRIGTAALSLSPHYRPPHWPTYLLSFPRYLLGQPRYLLRPIPSPWLERFDGLFWAIVVVLVLAGIPSLVRRRRWDCLALIGSFPIGLFALNHMGGAEVLSSGFNRYGAFLLVPTALALAFLARQLLFSPGLEGVRPRARLLPVTISLGLAAASLVTFENRYFRGTDFCGRESVWTFQTDTPGPSAWAYHQIIFDIERSQSSSKVRADRSEAPTSEAAPRGVIAQDWWVGRPLEFLALNRPDLKVFDYEPLKYQLPPDRILPFLRKRIDSNDYFVAYSFQPNLIHDVVHGLEPPDRFELWTDPAYSMGLVIERHRSTVAPQVHRLAEGPAKGGKIRAR